MSNINVEQIKVIQLPPRRTDAKKVMEGLQGFFKAEVETLRRLEEARAAQTPAWWRQWQNDQTAKSS